MARAFGFRFSCLLYRLFFRLAVFAMKSEKNPEKTGKIEKLSSKFFLTFFYGIAELRVIPGFGPWCGPKPGGRMTGRYQKSNSVSSVGVAVGESVVPVDDGQGRDVVDETPLSANRRTSSSSNLTFREEKPI